MTEPIVTALVSTYNAERFMRGCLTDLVQQTLGERLEILVIDSGSPQNEKAIVDEFRAKHGNIRYLRTSFREDSSGAFNRGIPLARGRYLTMANTDDRHRPDALEVMARVLDTHPEFGLVYADSLIGTVPDEPFLQTTARTRFCWPDYTTPTALSCVLYGPQPMWRHEVHERVGVFDSSYPIANDEDMFLRISADAGAVHLRETLGLFLKRPDSNSGADHQRETIADVLAVVKRFRREIPLERMFPGLAAHPEERAAARIEMGNLCALGPYNDYTMAMRFYSEAADAASRCQGVATAGVATAYANNVGCVLAAAGLVEQARSALATAGGPIAERNLEVLAGASGELQFAEVHSPVVAASRHTRGLQLAADGRLRWGESHEQVPWDVYAGPNGVPVSEVEFLDACAGRPRSHTPDPDLVAHPR